MPFPRLFRSKRQSEATTTEDASEEEGLINESGDAPKEEEEKIPYPAGQLFVLGSCRLSEPISMTSSQPYIYFMIRDFHIVEDETQIPRYAGFLSACYSLSQSITGIIWGRVSDSYGRKPCVLLGLLGTVIATQLFGFSRAYWQALLARSVAGLLNGNVGVIRTMVGEMEIAPGDQAKAFSVMPFVSNIGSILGPVVGGLLADPVDQYPSVFGNSRFFQEYPYALPNLVTGTCLFISFIFGFLFLEETHEFKKGKRDMGMRIRTCFRTLFFRKRSAGYNRLLPSSPLNERASSFSELDNELAPISPAGSLKPPKSAKTAQPRPPLRQIFRRQVLMNMFVWACLAVQNNTFGQLFPVFCSSDARSGGLGMRPGQIGTALSIAGIMAVLFQMTVFPWAYNRFGGPRCLRVSLGMYPFLYSSVPLLNKILANDHFDNSPRIWAGILFLLCIRTLINIFTRPILAILLTQSAPSKATLGTINGANQALAALCRALGPSIGGLVLAKGFAIGKPWICWVGLAGFSTCVFIGGLFLVDSKQTVEKRKEYERVENENESQVFVVGEEEEDDNIKIDDVRNENSRERRNDNRQSIDRADNNITS